MLANKSNTPVGKINLESYGAVVSMLDKQHSQQQQIAMPPQTTCIHDTLTDVNNRTNKVQGGQGNKKKGEPKYKIKFYEKFKECKNSAAHRISDTFNKLFKSNKGTLRTDCDKINPSINEKSANHLSVYGKLLLTKMEYICTRLLTDVQHTGTKGTFRIPSLETEKRRLLIDLFSNKKTEHDFLKKIDKLDIHTLANTIKFVAIQANNKDEVIKTSEILNLPTNKSIDYICDRLSTKTDLGLKNNDWYKDNNNLKFTHVKLKSKDMEIIRKEAVRLIIKLAHATSKAGLSEMKHAKEIAAVTAISLFNYEEHIENNALPMQDVMKNYNDKFGSILTELNKTNESPLIN